MHKHPLHRLKDIWKNSLQEKLKNCRVFDSLHLSDLNDPEMKNPKYCKFVKTQNGKTRAAPPT